MNDDNFTQPPSPPMKIAKVLYRTKPDPPPATEVPSNSGWSVKKFLGIDGYVHVIPKDIHNVPPPKKKPGKEEAEKWRKEIAEKSLTLSQKLLMSRRSSVVPKVEEEGKKDTKVDVPTIKLEEVDINDVQSMEDAEVKIEEENFENLTEIKVKEEIEPQALSMTFLEGESTPELLNFKLETEPSNENETEHFTIEANDVGPSNEDEMKHEGDDFEEEEGIEQFVITTQKVIIESSSSDFGEEFVVATEGDVMSSSDDFEDDESFEVAHEPVEGVDYEEMEESADYEELLIASEDIKEEPSEEPQHSTAAVEESFEPPISIIDQSMKHPPIVIRKLAQNPLVLSSSDLQQNATSYVKKAGQLMPILSDHSMSSKTDEELNTQSQKSTLKIQHVHGAAIAYAEDPQKEREKLIEKKKQERAEFYKKRKEERRKQRRLERLEMRRKLRPPKEMAYMTEDGRIIRKKRRVTEPKKEEKVEKSPKPQKEVTYMTEDGQIIRRKGRIPDAKKKEEKVPKEVESKVCKPVPVDRLYSSRKDLKARLFQTTYVPENPPPLPQIDIRRSALTLAEKAQQKIVCHRCKVSFVNPENLLQHQLNNECLWHQLVKSKPKPIVLQTPTSERDVMRPFEEVFGQPRTSIDADGNVRPYVDPFVKKPKDLSSPVITYKLPEIVETIVKQEDDMTALCDEIEYEEVTEQEPETIFEITELESPSFQVKALDPPEQKLVYRRMPKVNPWRPPVPIKTIAKSPLLDFTFKPKGMNKVVKFPQVPEKKLGDERNFERFKKEQERIRIKNAEIALNWRRGQKAKFKEIK